MYFKNDELCRSKRKIDGDHVAVHDVIQYTELVNLGGLRVFVREKVLTHGAFNGFFACWIILNIIALGMDSHGISPEKTYR